MNFDRKKFYKVLLFLCIPITIQNLISALVNMVDTVMISALGTSSIAAVGIANQFFFLYNMVVTGICSGAIVFISQFFGRNDSENIKKVTAFTTLATLIFGIVFGLIAILAPHMLIGIFSSDPSVVNPAIEYFKVIGWAYPLIAVSSALGMCSRAIRRPYIGMVSSGIALIVNIILNYGLILGNLGMPKLGVSGAAIATLSARLVELVIIIGYIFVFEKDHPLHFKLSHLANISVDFLKQFLSKSIPIFLNDTVWAVGTIAYTVAYSVAGTEAIASGQIAGTTSNLFLLITICLATGGAIMIGNELGAGKIDLAITYAKKLGIIIFIAGLVMGGVLVLSTPLLIDIFHVQGAQVRVMERVFIVIGGLMALKALNTFIVISVLRSGGDTKFAMIVEIIGMWACAIPLTFYGASHGYPMYMLVLFTHFEEFVKFVTTIPRVITKKWAVNLVDEM